MIIYQAGAAKKAWNFTILGILLERGRTYSRCGPNYEKRPSLLTSVQFIDAVGVKWLLFGDLSNSFDIDATNAHCSCSILHQIVAK